MKNSFTPLFLAFLMAFLINPMAQIVEANFAPPPLPRICIRSDGAIIPPNVPLKRTGNLYTFTGNITDFSLSVGRDNIVIDGAGFFITQQKRPDVGIEVSDRKNITVRGVNFFKSSTVICLHNSSFNVITGNSARDTYWGIRVSDESTYNIIAQNNILSSDFIGIYIQGSNNNTVKQTTYPIATVDYKWVTPHST